MPTDCLPDKFLQLGGFSKENIDNVILQLSNTDVLRKLKTGNVLLYSLCSQPLYTVFVVAVFKENTNTSYNTLTGVLICLISNFVRHKNTKDQTYENFPKLMKLAFHGTVNNRVTFTDEDLKVHGLTKDDIDDFLYAIPSASDAAVTNILETGQCVNFTHQNIQEFLTAMYLISSCDLNNFQAFVSENFTEGCSQWVMVHRMVLGLTCQPQITKEWASMNQCKYAIFNIAEY